MINLNNIESLILLLWFTLRVQSEPAYSVDMIWNIILRIKTIFGKQGEGLLGACISIL